MCCPMRDVTVAHAGQDVSSVLDASMSFQLKAILVSCFVAAFVNVLCRRMHFNQIACVFVGYHTIERTHSHVPINQH